MQASTAIIKSFDNFWSHGYQPHNEGFNYNGLLLAYYRALASNNVNTDVVDIDSGISGYKVVFMPAFNLMKKEIKDRVENYVNQGGIIILTFRSGTRTWNNMMTVRTLPGEFREMAGITVEEFDSLNSGRTVGITGTIGKGTASIWCDILKTEGAEVLAAYTSDYYAGLPAVTVNSYGAGKVYYVGCNLDEGIMVRLVEAIIKTAGVDPILPEYTEGVEAVLKEKDGNKYLMVLNHNSKYICIKVNGSHTELISGRRIDAVLELEPYGVAIFL